MIQLIAQYLGCVMSTHILGEFKTFPVVVRSGWSNCQFSGVVFALSLVVQSVALTFHSVLPVHLQFLMHMLAPAIAVMFVMPFGKFGVVCQRRGFYWLLAPVYALLYSSSLLLWFAWIIFLWIFHTPTDYHAGYRRGYWYGRILR